MAHSLTEQSRDAVANSASDGAHATPSTMRWWTRATLATSANGAPPAGGIAWLGGPKSRLACGRKEVTAMKTGGEGVLAGAGFRINRPARNHDQVVDRSVELSLSVWQEMQLRCPSQVALRGQTHGRDRLLCLCCGARLAERGHRVAGRWRSCGRGSRTAGGGRRAKTRAASPTACDPPAAPDTPSSAHAHRSSDLH